MKRLWILLLAVSLAGGCAVAPGGGPRIGEREVSPAMLLGSSPLGPGSPPRSLGQVDVLEVTPEMAAFLDRYVGDTGNRFARMRRLVDAIMGGEEFLLVYDESTRTAEQTFADRRGNCLSFTNLFVALARYLDIEANFQEVEVPPDWSLAGESMLFSQHVNVHIDLGADEVRVVDFNLYDVNLALDRRVISDQRARAHYFSNIGVDHMLGGRNADSYWNLRQALLEDATFGPAWINLGILHRREGYPAHAEAAYLQALEVDAFNPVAMSNLASLYEEEGLEDKASYYRDRVQQHRMSNPYYRYFLAQSAVVEGDYRGAIEHLRFAIRKRENEPRFYSLLSVSYLMAGDRDAAEAWMQKAESVAAEGQERQRYHRKLEWLMSQGRTP